jgi:5-methylcytosine-specific restriction endonuclease McrA
MAWSDTSRHDRGYGTAWYKTRARIMRRDKRLCQTCRRAGRATVATEVNHVKPKAQGGTDDEANLEAICSPCHKAETARQKGHRTTQAIGDDGWPT